MDAEKMMKYAAEEGFAASHIVSTEKIIFDPTFRTYCEENLCGQYGASYSCPPVCGTPEEMKQRILKHKHALVLQTRWEISDYSNSEAIHAAKTAHDTGTIRLMKRLHEEGYEGFGVATGGCTWCKTCAITKGEPCSFPDQVLSCMSAYCISVKKLTEICNMEYNYGEGLLAFFGMFVFD